MKLLGQPNSINVRKVLWTCAELGLSPELEDWGGDTNDVASKEFQRLNPKQLVPVLIDGDLVLSESNTICRYLAARYGQGNLLPGDPGQRAVVESWMDWQATDLNTAWRVAFMGRVRQHRDFQDAEQPSKSIAHCHSAMQILDDDLASSMGFVWGYIQFILADIALALSANRWEMTPMDRPELKKVSAWMARLSDRPAFGLFMPERSAVKRRHVWTSFQFCKIIVL